MLSLKTPWKKINFLVLHSYLEALDIALSQHYYYFFAVIFLMLSLKTTWKKINFNVLYSYL